MPSAERRPAHALEDSQRRERLTFTLQQMRSLHRGVLVLRIWRGLTLRGDLCGHGGAEVDSADASKMAKVGERRGAS